MSPEHDKVSAAGGGGLCRRAAGGKQFPGRTPWENVNSLVSSSLIMSRLGWSRGQLWISNLHTTAFRVTASHSLDLGLARSSSNLLREKEERLSLGTWHWRRGRGRCPFGWLIAGATYYYGPKGFHNVFHCNFCCLRQPLKLVQMPILISEKLKPCSTSRGQFSTNEIAYWNAWQLLGNNSKCTVAVVSIPKQLN